MAGVTEGSELVSVLSNGNTVSTTLSKLRIDYAGGKGQVQKFFVNDDQKQVLDVVRGLQKDLRKNQTTSAILPTLSSKAALAFSAGQACDEYRRKHPGSGVPPKMAMQMESALINAASELCALADKHGFVLCISSADVKVGGSS